MQCSCLIIAWLDANHTCLQLFKILQLRATKSVYFHVGYKFNIFEYLLELSCRENRDKDKTKIFLCNNYQIIDNETKLIRITVKCIDD